MSRKHLPIALAMLAATASGALAQDMAPPKEGEDANQIAFNTHCRNCHSVKPGDNRLGPTLHNIVGAEAGKVEGFGGYSGELKGFKWDEAQLDKFMANPSSIAPGTTMKPFGGIAEAEERKKVIEYLKAAK